MKHVLNMRDPHQRIARWMNLFAEFDFEILYRPTDKKANADYLSRPVEGGLTMRTDVATYEPELDSVIEYWRTGNAYS